MVVTRQASKDRSFQQPQKTILYYYLYCYLLCPFFLLISLLLTIRPILLPTVFAVLPLLLEYGVTVWNLHV